MSLRERCKEFAEAFIRNALFRETSSVDDLMAFVIAETGRKADQRLEETLPLCLYFDTERDRDEFVAAVQAVKPNLRAKKLP